MNDDIEILDIFDKKDVDNKVEIKKEEIIDQPKKKVVKKKLKTRALQLAFCIISGLFILGCIIFYGARFIKYYRIYNPKLDGGPVLLGNQIAFGDNSTSTEGESGLYSANGGFVFRGKIDRNYLQYNNMLWRVVRINEDRSIDVILDDYINILPWNSEVSEFTKSEIYDYLNNDFLNQLDKSLLVEGTICNEMVDDIKGKTCDHENIVKTYVSFLSVSDFLGATIDSKNYLVDDEEIFWLRDYSSDKIWHTNGSNVSRSDSNVFYEVRPVVRLSKEIHYTKGNGTIDNPYIVDKSDTLSIGSIVNLDNDKWIVYDKSDNVKLMHYELLNDKKIFDKKKLNYDESSLKEYLNTTYLDSLSYKDKIIDSEWYIGSYENKLSDIKKSKTTAKVGLPNMLDIKFDSEIKEYFTSTSNADERIWVYTNPLRPSRITSERNIRPCITISKEYANKLVYRDGMFVEE